MRQSEASISVGDFIFIFLNAALLLYVLARVWKKFALLSTRSSEVRIKFSVFVFSDLRIVQ